jgi:hypothetical protein
LFDEGAPNPPPNTQKLVITRGRVAPPPSPLHLFNISRTTYTTTVLFTITGYGRGDQNLTNPNKNKRSSGMRSKLTLLTGNYILLNIKYNNNTTIT